MEVRPKVDVSDRLLTYFQHTLGPILGSRPICAKAPVTAQGPILGSRPGTEVRPKVHVSDILPTYLRHTLGPILGSRPDLLKGSIHGSRPHSRLKARNRGETQSLRV